MAIPIIGAGASKVLAGTRLRAGITGATGGWFASDASDKVDTPMLDDLEMIGYGLLVLVVIYTIGQLIDIQL